MSAQSEFLTHRGYKGSIEPSVEDDCLYGQVLFINDTLIYSGNTIPELKQNFIQSVDEYLADCEALGKDPDQPMSGTFNVRITPELHRYLSIKAMQVHDGKLNRAVTQAIQNYVGPQNLEVSHEVHIHIRGETQVDFARQFENSSWTSEAPSLKVV